MVLSFRRERAAEFEGGPALTPRVALSAPAMPAAPTTIAPLMASTDTSRRRGERAVRDRQLQPVPAVFSKTSEPLSSWPTTGELRVGDLDAQVRAGGQAERAADVVLTASVTVPVRTTFGTLSVSVAATEPLMPAALSVNVAVRAAG